MVAKGDLGGSLLEMLNLGISSVTGMTLAAVRASTGEAEGVAKVTRSAELNLALSSEIVQRKRAERLVPYRGAGSLECFFFW